MRRHLEASHLTNGTARSKFGSTISRRLTTASVPNATALASSGAAAGKATQRRFLPILLFVAVRVAVALTILLATFHGSRRSPIAMARLLTLAAA
jgi:hypothetical protein